MFKIIKLDVGLNFIDYAKRMIEKSEKNVVFICSNRRPIRFIEKELTTETALRSEFFTIEEFAKNLTLNYARPIPKFHKPMERELFFLKLMEKTELFEKLGGEPATVFPWARRLSGLFDEIDRQLLSDRLQNFQYVEAIKQAEEILNNLKSLYEKYTEEYEQFSYGGKNLQLCAAITKDKKFIEDYGDRAFIFAGFIYLSESEKKILKNISDFADVSFVIQTDLFERDRLDKYLGFESFAAAKRTIRQLENIINNARIIEEKDVYNETAFEFYEFADSHSEASFNAKKIKVAADRLKNKQSPDNIAIILPESSTLLPLLAYFGKKDEKSFPINITMGLGFASTDMGIFLESFFNVLTDAERKCSSGKSKYTKYTVDSVLLNRLLNTNIFYFLKIDTDAVRSRLRDKMVPVYVFDESEQLFEQLIKPFLNLKNIRELHQAFIKLFKLFDSEKLSGEHEKFTSQMIQFFYSEIVSSLGEMDYGFNNLDARFIHTIISEMIRDLSVPFEGHPLEGIQIMGVLESRLLSFDSVFFLDVNEGILPAGDKIDPLLAEPIKQELGLSSFKEKEELVKYNFFRLAYSSNACFISYKTGSNALEKNIRSRFVEQLALIEENKTKKPLAVKNITVNLPKTTADNNFIEKTDEIRERLDEILIEPISPSSLDTYLNCPYKFYLKYIKKIGESPSFESEFRADKTGSLIHKLFEIGFRKYQCEDRSDNCKKIDKETYLSIGRDVVKKIGELPKNSGEFKDMKDVEDYVENLSKFQLDALKIIAKYRIKQFFNRTAKNSFKPFCVVGIEKKLSDNNLLLKGFADRIDKYENTIRIIDYKTGLYANLPSKNKTKELFDEDGLKNKDVFDDKTLIDMKSAVNSVQIPVYLILAQKYYNDYCQQCDFEGSLCYIGKSDDKPCKTLSVNDLSIEHSIEIVGYIKNHMKKSNRLYAISNAQCRYCDFALFCRFAYV